VSVKRVCPDCNNGVLSYVDRELCSRSYLSVVASVELGKHLWQAWDMDDTSNHLLLEARPVWHSDYVLRQLICYPQIIFEQKGPEVYFDLQESNEVGRDNFILVLKKAARHAFKRYLADSRTGIFFEPIRSAISHDGYRMPPRILTNYSFHQIEKNIENVTFILRYATDDDRDFALKSLGTLNVESMGKNWAEIKGSFKPPIGFYFDIGDTVRGLLKMGLNLIAAVTERTPVTRLTFPDTIRLIVGEIDMTPQYFDRGGFVEPSELEQLHDKDGGHSFRITYDNQRWRVYSSFFGGKICSAVSIPGPHKESWLTTSIVLHPGSKDWHPTNSGLFQPIPVKLHHVDSSKIVPLLKLQSSKGDVVVVPEKRKRWGKN